MLLFRSEEHVGGWCRARGVGRGETLGLARTLELANRWYGNRLDPDWRPRTRNQARSILEGLGLVSSFWNLPA